MQDWSMYAGRWLALTESGHVVGIAEQREEALLIGRSRQPKDRLRLVWISPHPPHIALPDWPLGEISPYLDPTHVWLAGGAVRDLLLGRTMHDWDFVVDGPAIPLARHVADVLHAPFYPLDEQRDTGRVLLKHPESHEPVFLDFARLRSDSLEADLRLRDFTINAIALTLDGQVRDPTGGQRDLQRGIIRLTHTRSFDDDPLRLLRAVRQAGDTGFRLEPTTEAMLQRKAALIARPSPERVSTELRQIIGHTPASPGLSLLQRSGLLAYVLPEADALRAIRQTAPHVFPTVWGHTIAALYAIEGILALVRGATQPPNAKRPGPRVAWDELTTLLHSWQPSLLEYLREELSTGVSRGELLKWAVLYHDVGKVDTRSVDEQGRTHFYQHEQIGAEMTARRLDALRFAHKARDFVVALVRRHMTLLPYRQQRPTRRAIYRFYRRNGDAGVGIILVALADTLAVYGNTLAENAWRTLLQAADDLLRAYFSHHDEVIAPPPLLSGKDVLALGVPEGPLVGQWLDRLREMQAIGQLVTREDARAWLREQLGTPHPSDD